jgi:fibronectin-binding autotransporter adhesin
MKPKRNPFFAAALSLATLAITVTTSYAQSGTWTGAAGTGIWGGVGNWTSSIVASGASNTANFTSEYAATQNVTVNSLNRTIGNITFTDTTSSHDVNIVAATPTPFLLTLDVATGSPAINVTQADRTLTISNVVAGTKGLTKSGAGRLILTNSNTFTGAAIVSAGTLRATGTAGALGAGSLTMSGGTLQLANDTALAFGRNTTVTGNSTITSDRLAAGAGVTHTLGTLSIGAQTLTVERGSLATSGTGGITFGNATQTAAATFSPQANAAVTLGGTTALGTFTLNKSGAGSMTATGVVSGGSTTAGNNSINVTAGTLTLSAAGNTFSGDVVINGATAIVSMAGGTFTTTNPLGNQASVYKSVEISNGGTFRLSSGNYGVNTPTATNVGAGQVFNIGTGGGIFDVASGSTFTIDDGTGSGTAWTNTQLQGSGALTKIGAGVLSLGNSTASNAVFTGQINVNEGTLRLGAVAAAGVALGSTSAGTVIASGASLDVGSNLGTTAEPLTITGTGVGGTSNVIFTSSTATTPIFAGPVTLAGNSTIGTTTAGTITFTGTSTFALGSNTLTIRNTSTGRVFTDGVISGTGSLVMNSSSTGDYVPRAGDHTYSGGTTLTAGFVAVDRDSIGSPGSPTSGPFGTGTVTLAGAQLRSGTGANRAFGNAVTVSADTTFYTVATEKNLTFTGPVTLTGGTRTLTANVGTTVPGISTIFNGAIGDGGNALGLIKAGTGNLILGAANTYTGGTTVNAGNLNLTGSVPTNTALTINPTTAAGASFTLASDAANPLADVSTLTLGSATGPTTLGFDLGAATASSDSINTPSAATTAGTVNIAISALAGFGSASTYDLITASSGLGGATFALTNAPGGFLYSLTQSATLLQLGVTPATAGDLFWRGNTNGSWSAISGSSTNWFTDAAGSTNAQANPGAGDTVNFSSINATNTAGVISTTLDNNFTVNKILFGSDPNGVTSVSIAPGLTPVGVPGILAIAPTSSTDGLNVGSNAGNVTISAPIILGANQTWSANGTGLNGSALTVSGAISGTATLGISGLITLSAPGTSTYSGATTVPNGAILQGGATNSFSASSALTVSGTGIVRLNGFSNTVLSLAGDGTVQNNHASTAATLTAGDANDVTFTGTLQNGGVGALGLTKTGAGILTLSGTNTHTGATTITAGTIRQGSAGALSGGGSLTVNGTSVFDLNGFNTSVSTLGGVATAFVTDNSAGSGTTTLSITAAGTSAAAITNGATKSVALRVTNGNGAFLLSNASNTFSGGIVLTNSVGGTRMSPGTITAGAYGTGAITIGESPTDQAGIYFATGTQTLTNPIIFNTARGTDRVGIRTDAAGITLSGVITANLAPATFTANTATAGSFILTNQVTGASGIVLDITSLSASATSFLVTLNNTAGTNNYQGDTIVNLNAASGKSATLQLLAADQIPNGSSAGNVFVNSNGTGIGLLSLAGGNETINGLNGSGNVASTSGTVTLTLGDNNATGNHSGSINNTAGTLSVTKIGTGMQTLSGASNFAGALTVNGGIVAFPSSPASAGPLGNSTVVNLNDGAISYTSAGANALNRTLAIGASNGTVDVQNATGVLSMAGASVTSSGGNLLKTGAGTVAISGTTTLSGGAASVAVNAGTLQAGFGTAGVATITVGATGNLDQRNAATEALVLSNVAGALTVSGGASLGFEFDGANNDKIDLGTTGTAVTSGVITLNLFNTGSGIAAGTYDLLTSASGGLDDATYALGSAPNGFNYTINVTDTNVSVTVTNYTPIFWRGAQDLSWNTLGAGTANWTTDSAGTVDATSLPVSTDTVVLSATGAPNISNTISTTLDAAFVIDSLQFSNIPTGITAVTIAAGASGTLTLSPVSTSGGIRVLSGGGIATISAPLTTTTAQTWDVDPTGSLVISGDTTFTGAVNKTNSGALTLSGNNSGAAAFTLSGGTLNLNSATALGSGLFTIGAGTTLNTPTAAITLSNNNAQTWNGDYTFTGANNLNLGTGAVTMNNSVALTTTANTLTVGGNIGDGGSNRSLTKAGGGTLVLTGANTYGGATTINSGVLRITGATGLGTVAGGTIQTGDSTLELDGTAGGFTVGNEPLTIRGGGYTLPTPNLGALRNIAGDNTYGGTVTMSAQSRINSDSGTLTLSNPASVSSTNLSLVVGGAGNLTISGAIALGTGGVNKADGAGTLTLSGTNTYSGATTVTAGTLTLTSGGSITTAANILLNINGAAVANLEGTYTSTGGGGVAINSGGILNTSGTVSISGANNQAILMGTAGGSGTWNVTGGSVSVNYASNGWGLGNGGVGTLNVSAGSVTTAGSNVFNIGHAANSTGNLNISGTGLVTINPGAGLFTLGTTSTSTATVNLDGGTFVLGRNITKNATAVGTFNFNGGLLRAGLTSTTYFPALALTTANVRDGGAKIDTNGFNITVGQALIHSALGGDAATDGGLTKSGTGILTLSGANTYTGATQVNGGTLQLNTSAATGVLTTNGVTIGASGTLGFTAAAASTLDLTGKPLTLSGGSLAFDVGGGVNDAITVQDFTITADSSFTFDAIGAVSNGSTYTVLTSANAITNSGPFSITGQTIGRVILTPTINTNTITVSASLNEGIWSQAGGGNWSDGDPDATGGNWTNYKPTILGDAALFGSAITAPSTVVVDTPHSLAFLRFDNATHAYTIGSNGSSNLSLNNGADNASVAVTSGSHEIAENVTLISNMGAELAAATNLTMSGIVTGTGKSVQVSGSGTLVLSGANTYTGTTTVSGGALTLSGARTATMGVITVGNQLSTTATLNVSNGTFTTGQFNVGSGDNPLTAGIVNQTGGTLTMSSNQLLLGNGGAGTTSGSNSTGTYNLSGGTLNTIAGGTGVLIGVNTGTTGVFNLSGTGNLAMPATSTMQIGRSDNNGATNTTGTFSQTGGTATVGILQMSGTAAAAVNNAGASSTLTLTGGTFAATTFNALSGANNSSSVITIGDTAQVTLPAFPTNAKGTSATATITFDSTTGFLSPVAASATYMPAGTFTNAYLTANGAKFNIPTTRDITVAQVLEDAVSPAAAGTLGKSGVGNLTLSGANTYTGATSVNAGTIIVGNVDAFGTTAADTTVASGARITFNALATNATVAEAFTISGTGTTANNGALNMGGSKIVNLTGAITLAGNSLVTADGAAALNFTGVAGITGTDTNLSFNTDGSVASSITGPLALGTGSLTKTGTSTLILSGNSTYSGGTTIAGGAINVATSNNALGSGSVNINGGLRLAVAAGLDVANSITITSTPGAVGRGVIESSGASGTATVSGPINILGSPGAGGVFLGSAGTVLHLAGVITAPAQFSQRDGRVMYSGGGTGYTSIITTGTAIVGANNGIATTAEVRIGGSAAATLDLNGFNQSLSGVVQHAALAATIGNSSTTADSVLTTTGTSTYIGTIVNAVSGGTRKVGLAVDSGQLTLTGDNSFTGDITVNGGKLSASAGPVASNSLSGLGASSNTRTITVESGATLEFGAGNLFGNHATVNVPSIVVNGGTVTNADLANSVAPNRKVNNALNNLTLNGGTLTATKGNEDSTDIRPGEGYGAWGLNGTVTSTGASTIDTTAVTGKAGHVLLSSNTADTVFDVVSGTLTVASVLQTGDSVTNYGLTKSGTGTLALTAANVYTGNTTVNAGTLALADNAQLKFVLGATSGTNNSLSGAGNASLDGDFVIDTTAADSLPSGTWTLENVTGLTGAYGSTFTVVGFTDAGSNKWTKVNGAKLYTFDETTGVLTLGSALSAYDSWAASKGLDDSDAAHSSAKGDDPDNDGKNNLYEFAFDGNPLSGANDGKIVGKIGTVGADQVMTLTVPVRDTAAFTASGGDQLSALIDAITYRIEGDVDLGTFANTISEVTGGDATAIQAGLPTLSTGWTYRTFRDAGTVPTVPKVFLRAKISE